MSRGLNLSRLIVALAVVVAAGAFTSTAFGAPGSGGQQGSGGQIDGVIAARVAVSSGGPSGGGDGCTWTLANGELSDGINGTATWPRTDLETGVVFNLWAKRCVDGTRLFEFPETTPAELIPAALERLRERVLPRPVPVFELLDPEFGWAYVRTPLDFRAGGDSWRTVSVTAALGPVWATVTATPSMLTFDPGDPAGPGPVSCGGDGPIAVYVASEPGACSYSYQNASSTSLHDGYHFLTSLTIDWVVSWTSSVGGGGPLEPFQSSSTAELAVAEVRGIVVCTGSRPEQGGC